MLTSSFELDAAGLQLDVHEPTSARILTDPGPEAAPLLYPVHVAARLHASKLPADPLLPALRASLTLGALEARLTPEQLAAARTALMQLRAAATAAAGGGRGGDGQPDAGSPGDWVLPTEDSGTDEKEALLPSRLDLQATSGAMRVCPARFESCYISCPGTLHVKRRHVTASQMAYALHEFTCDAQVTYDDASAREADADDTHLAVRCAVLDLRVRSYMGGRLDCKVLWHIRKYILNMTTGSKSACTQAAYL